MTVWLKWLPWKFVIKRISRSHGFLDPIALLSRLHSFAQPSEVGEPVELLRAGVVLHARGLINSRVIQHNLDWVWPYWIESQFDPDNDAFVPRAFSITHINLTHRNWTAVGLPDFHELPIVDPRGLVTPFLDSWSVDCWIVSEDGLFLLPSRAANCSQSLDTGNGVKIDTSASMEDLRLVTQTDVDPEAVECRIRLQATAGSDAWAVIALRPYNPEGISFIHEVSLTPERNAWLVDGEHQVKFNVAADRHHISDYRSGDVYIHLHDLDDETTGQCNVGMVTAAALFRLTPGQTREITVSIPLKTKHEMLADRTSLKTVTWEESLQDHCRLDIPDKRFQFLYDAAIRTLILHSPDDVFPGPYTYKRFWFRDAAFIINGLLCAGLTGRAERALDRFPSRQKSSGYFHSQDGEWDSNGEALWILQKFCEMTGRLPKDEWRHAILQGARWIDNKRLPEELNELYAGLLPAGFSAEHLGPNDYYYWDDFWGIAGLQAAAELADAYGDQQAHAEFSRQASSFAALVDRNLEIVSKRLGRSAMPASPFRRLDAGAIGSIVAGYPLKLFPEDDSRLLDCVDFLIEHCFYKGGFFQDMIHSGINAYLTLHIAQILLRAGDPRYFELMTAVADLASPTGQWPEAIHPRTHGGCMGDGQHVWAAAEWVIMIRNCFIREEGDRLILLSGIPSHWLEGDETLAFGPAPSSFGDVTITVVCNQNKIKVSWQGLWHDQPPGIEIQLPGYKSHQLAIGQNEFEFDRIVDRLQDKKQNT